MPLFVPEALSFYSISSQNATLAKKGHFDCSANVDCQKQHKVADIGVLQESVRVSSTEQPAADKDTVFIKVLDSFSVSRESF